MADQSAVLDSRCSDRATRRADSMLGTAFPASRILLVEQPGPWGPAGLAASRLPTPIATRLVRRWAEIGVRVQAVRRTGRTQAPARRGWGFADCRAGSAELRWSTFGPDEELLDLMPEQLEQMLARATVIDKPIFLVCAHGAHDACCAIKGRPIATSLAMLAPDRVWETSHLGGDRFAPNVLVLPLGALYGRVQLGQVRQLVQASDRAAVLPQMLRGQVGLPAPVQAAVISLRRRSRLLGEAEVTVLDTDISADGSVTVTLQAPGAVFEVTVQVQRLVGDGLTCRAAGPASFLTYRPADPVELVRTG